MSSKRRPRATPDVDAQAINLEHDKGEQAQRTSLEHFRRCGELLALKKASLSHGEWGPWLRANIKFAARTARRYMTFAELAKSATVADLPRLWDKAKHGKRGKDEDKDDDPDPAPPGLKCSLRAMVTITSDTPLAQLLDMLRIGQLHWVLRNDRDQTWGIVRVDVVESLERLED